MTIDKQQLQKLLWAEAASFRADCADWKRNTEALDEFLGEKTVAEVALELLAENERVKARLCVCRDCDGQGEVYSGHSSYQGHNQPPEPDMDVCGTCGGDGVLGPLEDFEALAAERDQLKAENEALRSDIQSWRLSIEAERNVHKLSLKGIQDELDRLTGPNFTAELAALRKSSGRYEWLRQARSGHIEVVEWIGPYATGMTGEDLNALLDAAMGKGEQS